MNKEEVQAQIDETVERLTQSGITINQIVDALQVQRGMFYSWKRSEKLERLEQMRDKIKEAFPDYFKDGWENEVRANDDTEQKYQRHLEETVRDLRKDKERLMQIIEKITDQK